MRLTDVPWHSVRVLFYTYRKTLFSVPKPEGVPKVLIQNPLLDNSDAKREEYDAIVKIPDIERPVQVFEEEMGRNNFHASFLSYHYKGQVLSIRKVRYDDKFEYPWRQLHIRVFKNGDILVHEEPMAEKHPKAHLKQREFSWERGTKMAIQELEWSDFPVEVVK